MGLGKTVQTISFFAYLQYRNAATRPHLIVVPTSTLGKRFLLLTRNVVITAIMWIRSDHASWFLLERGIFSVGAVSRFCLSNLFSCCVVTRPSVVGEFSLYSYELLRTKTVACPESRCVSRRFRQLMTRLWIINDVINECSNQESCAVRKASVTPLIFARIFCDYTLAKKCNWCLRLSACSGG